LPNLHACESSIIWKKTDLDGVGGVRYRKKERKATLKGEECVGLEKKTIARGPMRGGLSRSKTGSCQTKWRGTKMIQHESENPNGFVMCCKFKIRKLRKGKDGVDSKT